MVLLIIIILFFFAYLFAYIYIYIRTYACIHICGLARNNVLVFRIYSFATSRLFLWRYVNVVAAASWRPGARAAYRRPLTTMLNERNTILYIRRVGKMFKGDIPLRNVRFSIVTHALKR